MGFFASRAGQRAIGAGLILVPLLAGCTWADAAPSPLLPEPPVPSPAPGPPVPSPPAPSVPDPETTPEPLLPGGSTVVYSVMGTGTASVTYVLVHPGGVVQESSSATTLPFTKSMQVSRSGGGAPTTMTVAAVGINNAQALSCTITQDGAVLAEETATGPAAAVTCSATGR